MLVPFAMLFFGIMADKAIELGRRVMTITKVEELDSDLIRFDVEVPAPL